MVTIKKINNPIEYIKPMIYSHFLELFNNRLAIIKNISLMMVFKIVILKITIGVNSYKKYLINHIITIPKNTVVFNAIIIIKKYKTALKGRDIVLS